MGFLSWCKSCWHSCIQAVVVCNIFLISIMAPLLTPGSEVSTSCGTSRAPTRLPRRTLTSLHWRQGRQRPRPSHASARHTPSIEWELRVCANRDRDLGRLGPLRNRTLADLGGRIAQHTGDARSTAFLRQRLDIAIQRGNAAAVVGTLTEGNALQV